jgi:hypothetical protein
MKTILIFAAFLLAAANLFSQSRIKSDCINEKKCIDSISKIYNFKYLGNNEYLNTGYDTYLYKTPTNDTVYFVTYTKGKLEKITSIVGSYETLIELIYKKWYGRVADFQKIKSEGSDYWTPELVNRAINISKNRLNNNWTLKIY